MQFNTRIDEINDPILTKKGVRLFVKRDDLIHPYISGNKLYKLKYNVEDAILQGYDAILTFGGAYSNHLVATAAYCNYMGLRSIGIVRGEELSPLPNPPPLGEGTYAYKNLSPPLLFCQEQGMQLHFVSREEYRQKESADFIAKLKDRFGNYFYIVPEGGGNALGVKGASEILHGFDASAYTHMMAACGTGTTLAGMVLTPSLLPLIKVSSINVWGVSVLKGDDTLTSTVEKYVENEEDLPNWKMVTGYHHGGYAKTTPELLDFIAKFKEGHGITLDTVYTGKMFFAIYKMVEQGLIPTQSTILAIHTGGVSFS